MGILYQPLDALPKDATRIDPRAPQDVGNSQAILKRVEGQGIVVLPGTSLAEVIRQAQGSKGIGITRILLAPGDHRIRAAGIEITGNNIHIVGVGPTSRILRSGVPTASMFTLSGTGNRLDNVYLSDPDSTATECVTVTGDSNSITECTFFDVYGAVIVSSADYVRVQGNYISGNTKPDAIELSGTTSYSEVSGNIIV